MKQFASTVTYIRCIPGQIVGTTEENTETERCLKIKTDLDKIAGLRESLKLQTHLQGAYSPRGDERKKDDEPDAFYSAGASVDAHARLAAAGPRLTLDCGAFGTQG